jgi:uncharacterized SAM-binding protein YcdF (DUF218 family)
MFTVKSLFSMLLDPVLLGLLFFAFGMVLSWSRRWRRSGRTIAAVGIVLVLVLSLPVVAGLVTRPLEQRHPSLLDIRPVQEVEFVAVLGNMHSSDFDRPITAWLAGPALARLMEGVRICRQLERCTLVVSGWTGDQPQPYADVAAQAAVVIGVDARRIVRLTEPRDTREEMLAIRDVVTDRPFILVTSAVHMPRAVEAARRAGLSPIPAPTDYLDADRIGWPRFVPATRALAASHSAMYEYAGRLWYMLRR